MFSLKDKLKTTNGAHYIKSTPSSFDYAMLPKKIIKATMSYSACQLHELSFEQGDFFHVVGRANDRNWYAVNNPLTNTNGLVPVHCFEVVDKIPRTLSVIQPALPLDYPRKASKRILTPSPRHCYGIVLYNFVAERSDELDCKAEEAIMVIAQPNNEWYLAKPINRLSKHGLVPISFIQLYDITTQLPVSLSPPRPQRNSDRFSVSSSLSDHSLLVSQRNQRRQQLALSSPDPHSRHSFGSTTTCSHPNSTFITIKNRKSKLQEPSPRSSTESIAKVVHITVNSFIWERGQYWFVLYVTVENARHRILYRSYEDFNQFHLRLQQDYPDDKQKLPPIPKALDKMDDLITEQQREALDDYSKQLFSGPFSSLAQDQLFGLKHGDVETDYAPRKGSRVIKTAATPTMVKIKIAHQEDIFAVKLPANTTFAELQLRVKERVGGDRRMRYKDDSTLFALDTEMDMEVAFRLAARHGKLTVVVD